MPFLLMVFLTLVCLPPLEPASDRLWPEPLWFGTNAVWVALAVTATPILYAWLLSRRLISRLRRHPEGSDTPMRRFERGRRVHQLLLFGSFLAALCLFGWGAWVATNWRRNGSLLPGAELVLMLPFFVSLLASWLCFYDGERAGYIAGARYERTWLNEPAPAVEKLPPLLAGRWTYLGYQARQRLGLVFLPLGMMLVQKELARLFSDSSDLTTLVTSVGGALSAALLVWAMPWGVRLLLGLKPIPEGPLRQRLVALGRRLHFRCSNYLVWDTGSGVANAMVVGILPWPRYVLFTDRLLEEFKPEEVEAVLGHEIGHVRHFHMFLYLGFLMVSMGVFGAVLSSSHLEMWLNPSLSPDEAATSWQAHGYLRWLPVVAVVLAYIFVVFGYLSRRCERQADVVGCRAVSCKRGDCQGHDEATVMAPAFSGLCPTGIQTFCRALDLVAEVNGIDRKKPGFLQSWQHGSIAQRVDFLEGMRQDPRTEPRFQMRLILTKVGLFALLGFALLGLLLGLT